MVVKEGLYNKPTKKSLEENGLSSLFDELIFCKKPEYKKPICENKKCDFMIDDREDILLPFTNDHHTRTILFGSKNNAAIPSTLMRAADWKEVIQMIEETEIAPVPKNNTFTIVNIDRFIYNI